ncbi:MAG: hypothetical protein U0230_16370 [Polyangiales bacterium]
MAEARVVEPSAPAAGLFQPIPLVAIALLVLNDHVLKRAMPGLLTGKLSDFAGLAFFPLVLEALAEVVRHLLGRDARPSARRLALCTFLTGLVFAAIKTVAWAGDVYSVALGALQWPFAAALSAARGRPWPELHRVAFVRDATDLVALPALGLALLAGRARRARAPAGPGD